MPDENLVKYIKDGLEQGRSEDIIRSMLASAGWAQKDVDDAFNVVKGGAPTILQPLQANPAIVDPSPTATSVQQQQTIMQPVQEKAKFFSWKGRIGRLRYFISSIILAVILSIAGIGFIILAIPVIFGSVGLFGGFGFLAVPFLAILFVVIELFLSSFIVIKRFHDINKSGAYFWSLLIPFFNIYLSLSLLLECGTDGVNTYGGDPLPQGTDHNGFIARLGKSFAFKLTVTILLSALTIFGFIFNALHPQQTTQQQIDQAMNQKVINSLISSSTISAPSSSQPVEANSTSSPAPQVAPTTPVTDPNAPVTITVPLGAQRTTSQGVPITFKSSLSFTNADGATSQGADVIVIDNGTSSELLMQVGQTDNLTMHKITLEKVNSAGATFLVQDNYIINP